MVEGEDELKEQVVINFITKKDKIKTEFQQFGLRLRLDVAVVSKDYVPPSMPDSSSDAEGSDWNYPRQGGKETGAHSYNCRRTSPQEQGR